MSINYVIATYDGQCRRTHEYPKPHEVLMAHLEKITTLKHNLTKITVMKARNDGPKVKKYYNIEHLVPKLKCEFEQVDVENFGYSMGQWMKCYEMNKTYDWYIFIEDDYCPNMDNFDRLLVDMYKEKFGEDVGLLCSFIQGSKNYVDEDNLPLHFEGVVVLSRQTLEGLYGDKRWGGDPRKYLDLMTQREAKCLDRIRAKYLGGYYQLTFSMLFNLSGIMHRHYFNCEYGGKTLQFLYWNDNTNKIMIYKRQKLRDDVKIKRRDIENCPIIPVQLKDELYISKHVKL